MTFLSNALGRLRNWVYPLDPCLHSEPRLQGSASGQAGQSCDQSGPPLEAPGKLETAVADAQDDGEYALHPKNPVTHEQYIANAPVDFEPTGKHEADGQTSQDTWSTTVSLETDVSSKIDHDSQGCGQEQTPTWRDTEIELSSDKQDFTALSAENSRLKDEVAVLELETRQVHEILDFLNSENLVLQQGQRILKAKLYAATRDFFVMSRVRGTSLTDCGQDTADIKVSGHTRPHVDMQSSEGHDTFTSDEAFSPEDTALDIFDRVGLWADLALAGQSVCIIGYGQSGSGKSHTLFYSAQSQAELMLDHVLSMRQHDQQISVSFTEFYKQRPRDLLQSSDKALMPQSPDWTPETHCQPVDSLKDFLRLLTRACNERETGSTTKNAQSSRSHMVVLMKIENKGDITKRPTTIYMMDLTGSETIPEGDCSTKQKEEVKAINSDLAAVTQLLEGPDVSFAYQHNAFTKFFRRVVYTSKVLLMPHFSPLSRDVIKNHTTMLTSYNVSKCLHHPNDGRLTDLQIAKARAESQRKPRNVEPAVRFRSVPASGTSV